MQQPVFGVRAKGSVPARPTQLYSDVIRLPFGDAQSWAASVANIHITVPDYQRPYSWTVKEAGQMLDDLNLALDDVAGTQPVRDAESGAGVGAAESSYFFGAVLLMAHASSPAAQAPGQKPRLLASGSDLLTVLDAQRTLFQAEDQFPPGIK